MNAPDRLDAIRVPAGVKKVIATKDEKAANAYVYKVMREDHTLGNLMRMCVSGEQGELSSFAHVPR